MTKISYWHDLDSHLGSLLKQGYVKLPSLKAFNLDAIADKINAEMDGKTFAQSSPSHVSFLEDIELDRYLAPKLYKIAKQTFGFKGAIDNQYHIARRVSPGDSAEMFRAHFDSHLFTMVLPIKIPQAENGGTAGDLLYFPNARRPPNNEIVNFFGKAAHKRYASKAGIEVFAKKYQQYTENFQDYSPLLFFGNTTLHTNKQVSAGCSSYRLTLLAHFFDPSPTFGIGRILRMIRNR